MQHKKCTKCGEEKPATPEYFYERSASRDGLKVYCKQCDSSYGAAYREANKERLKESRKAYREANKERLKERRKVYYEANKERLRPQQKARREANKESKKEYDKAYREANKERILEYTNNHRRTSKGKWLEIRSRAKTRGLDFSLSLELYEGKLWGEPCHYCGVDIEVTGLDRKDTSKGYTPDNVVPCCWDCNRIKKDKPYEQFLEEIKKNTCIS